MITEKGKQSSFYLIMYMFHKHQLKIREQIFLVIMHSPKPVAA